MRRTGYLLFLGFWFSGVLVAQEVKVVKKEIIDLLMQKEYVLASAALDRHLDIYLESKNLDSLASYTYYVGKVKYHLTDASTAIAHTEKYIDKLKKAGAGDRHLFSAHMGYVYVLDELGRTKMSYDITEKALLHAVKMPDKTPEEIGFVHYNLGASAISLGKFNLAKMHFRKTLKHYEAYDKTDGKKLADAFNAMGAVMWMSTKLDSAQYYYKRSVEAIQLSETDSISKYFLSAITLANVALIQQGQGKTDAAMKTLQTTLQNYQKVIQYGKDQSQIDKAKRFQWVAMSNLAVFYNDIGDFSMANTLLTYVLESQQAELEPDDLQLTKTQVKIAQSLLSLLKYKEAKPIYTQALDALKNSQGEEPYWTAITLFGLAETEDALGNINIAQEYYLQSQTYFEKALQGNYDRQYLEFITKKTAFLAKHGEKELAEELALKGFNYTLKTAKNDFLIQFKQMVNVAEIYYETGNYPLSKQHSEEALQLLEKIQTEANTLDAVQVEYHKPRAMLYRAKSAYYLLHEKDTLVLKELYKSMQDALKILERQKSITINPENITILINNNKSVFQFIKKLGLDLFRQTGNPNYLNQVIGYHESGLYHKIRARFNKRNGIGFTGVPDEIIQKELALKQNIEQALQPAEANNNGLADFFEATEDWNTFLGKLKKEYPRYYAMRYETISENTALIQEKLDKNTTMVRYFFVEEQLYALVINATKTQLFPLEFTAIKPKLAQLHTSYELSKEYALLHDIYNMLWEPFAASVKTKNVIIIPDDILFTLSFETLLAAPTSNRSGFIQNSLLSKHIISYNYSLLMLHTPSERELQKNYVAFAPGFMEEMKSAYRNQKNRVAVADPTYLTLIPQPFTVDLVKQIKSKFTGEIFLYDASTRTNFITHAPGAKIVHIGTHAESNNLSPDLSRLLFAKEAGTYGEMDENSLYAYQIYNYDFTSGLAILTACETGKPEYQPGEGMISLAHAFNYAGSESMLTSLWQIDEQASAVIVESFYAYLADGYSKPEALQKAKLTYLSKAEGRTASPNYWAGLIIMGDPSPIFLEPNTGNWIWLFLLFFLLVLGGLFVLRRYKKI